MNRKASTETKKRQQEIVTFKADTALLHALRGIPNRSEFIRNAILAALESVCPLCMGTGILTPQQREHWEAFAKHHDMAECGDCHARVPICESHPVDHVHEH